MSIINGVLQAVSSAEVTRYKDLHTSKDRPSIASFGDEGSPDLDW